MDPFSITPNHLMKERLPFTTPSSCQQGSKGRSASFVSKSLRIEISCFAKHTIAGSWFDWKPLTPNQNVVAFGKDPHRADSISGSSKHFGLPSRKQSSTLQSPCLKRSNQLQGVVFLEQYLPKQFAFLEALYQPFHTNGRRMTTLPANYDYLAQNQTFPHNKSIRRQNKSIMCRYGAFTICPSLIQLGLVVSQSTINHH